MIKLFLSIFFILAPMIAGADDCELISTSPPEPGRYCCKIGGKVERSCTMVTTEGCAYQGKEGSGTVSYCEATPHQTTPSETLPQTIHHPNSQKLHKLLLKTPHLIFGCGHKGCRGTTNHHREWICLDHAEGSEPDIVSDIYDFHEIISALPTLKESAEGIFSEDCCPINEEFQLCSEKGTVMLKDYSELLKPNGYLAIAPCNMSDPLDLSSKKAIQFLSSAHLRVATFLERFKIYQEIAKKNDRLPSLVGDERDFWNLNDTEINSLAEIQDLVRLSEVEPHQFPTERVQNLVKSWKKIHQQILEGEQIEYTPTMMIMRNILTDWNIFKKQAK